MTLGWMVFEIAINTFQATLYLIFFKSRIFITRVSRVADISCILVYSSFLTVYLFFDLPVTDSLGSVIFLLYLLIVSAGPWYTCAFWVVVKEVVVIAVTGFMMQLILSFPSISYEILMAPSSIRVVAILSINLALFVALFVLSKMKLRQSALKWSVLLIFLTMNIAILVVIELLFSLQIQQPYESDWPFFISYTALIFCSILSVSLFYLMTDIAQRERRGQIALSHAELTKEHQQQLSDMYADMLARQHDFKHQIQTIEQLVQIGNSEDAKAYLIAYESKTPEQNPFTTGCIAVDALLMSKSLTCERKGVSFELTQCPLNDLPISDVDFCTIVGNLLDNAIEGANRCSDDRTTKWVHLSFSRVWDMFYIHCDNSMQLSSIRKKGTNYLTSKRDTPSVHGFGIPNIKAITGEASGFCSFETKDQIFVASVTLPYPHKKEESVFTS